MSSILLYVVSLVGVIALSVLATLLAAGQLKVTFHFGKMAPPLAVLTRHPAPPKETLPGQGSSLGDQPA